MSAIPDVAVVVPTRNRAALLMQTLQSVEAQTLTNWECLVVDDGSTDGTAEAVGHLTARDPRFRFLVLQGSASGANACRNRGVEECRAGLIVFLDSDDLLAPAALSHRVAAMGRNPDADFIVFDGDVFLDRTGDLGRRFDMGHGGGDLDRFLALDPPWDVTGPVWRKDYLNALGGFDTRLTSWQDVDLHIRALASGPRYFRVRTIDHHIRWQAREDRTSQRKAFSTEMFENCEPCLSAWRAALQVSGSATPARDEALAGIAFHLAEQWALQRHPARARRLWRGAPEFGVATAHVLAGTLFLTMMATRLESSTVFRGLLRRWKVGARLMPPTTKRKCS